MQFLLLLFSHQVMPNSSQPHGLQYTRLPCSSPSPRVCPSSCPLNWWFHPIGCWAESDLGEKTVASRSAHATQNTPELLQPVSLSPQWATAVPAAPHHHRARKPPIPAGRSDPGPGSYEATAFPPGSWCIWDLVCDLQKWNFSFPQSCNLIPLTFKARFSESSSLHCQTLSLGSLM